ncbi:hypothetical protein ACVGWF_24460, partial [Enterobacter asburiae]
IFYFSFFLIVFLYMFVLVVQVVMWFFLGKILVILLLWFVVLFMVMRMVGEYDRQRRVNGVPWARRAGRRGGGHAGHARPRAPSFYALAFVTLAGFNLAKS